MSILDIIGWIKPPVLSLISTIAVELLINILLQHTANTKKDK